MSRRLFTAVAKGSEVGQKRATPWVNSYANGQEIKLLIIDCVDVSD